MRAIIKPVVNEGTYEITQKQSKGDRKFYYTARVFHKGEWKNLYTLYANGYGCGSMFLGSADFSDFYREARFGSSYGAVEEARRLYKILKEKEKPVAEPKLFAKGRFHV